MTWFVFLMRTIPILGVQGIFWEDTGIGGKKGGKVYFCEVTIVFHRRN